MTELTITRAGTKIYNTAVTRGGVAQDLTGASMKFTARKKLTDAAFLFQKVIGTGITVVSAPAGTVRITLNPADTDDLILAPVTLFFDLQVTLATGEVFTSEQGTILVYPSVT